MNIIKSDSRCHLYRTCSPFPSLKPRHLVADAFRVGNKEHYQASEQPNKLANLLTLKTAGQKALIAGYMRLYSLDEMIWLKSKAIKNSTTIRSLKIEKLIYSTLFFTIFVNSLSVFFSYFLQGKNNWGNRKLWQTLRILLNYAKVYWHVIPLRACFTSLLIWTWNQTSQKEAKRAKWGVKNAISQSFATLCFTAKYLLGFAHSFFNHLFRLKAWLKLPKVLQRPLPLSSVITLLNDTCDG